MKRRIISLGLAVMGTLALFVPTCLSSSEILIWNRTGSAPEGLYWRRSGLPILGEWAVVSPEGPAAKWAYRHGFIGNNWPLIKQIAAITGDEVCRYGATISINNEAVAVALSQNFSGQNLPDWHGCIILSATEFFLLNAHPHSLDGRYFGPTAIHDISGTAIPIWTFRP